MSGPFTEAHCTTPLSCFSDVSTCEVPWMYWTMKPYGPLRGFPCGDVVNGKYTKVCDGGPAGDGIGSQCVLRSSIENPLPSSPPPPPNPLALPSSPPPLPEVSCEGKEDGTECMMNGGDKGACWKSSCSNRQKSCIHVGTNAYKQAYYGGVSASASCNYKTVEGISGPIDLVGNPYTADHCTKTLACFANDHTCFEPRDYWIMTDYGPLAGFPCGPIDANGKYTKVDGGPAGDGKGSQCVDLNPSSSTVTSLPPPPPPSPPPPTETTPTPSSSSPEPSSGTYPADPPTDVKWPFHEWTATVTIIEVGLRS